MNGDGGFSHSGAVCGRWSQGHQRPRSLWPSAPLATVNARWLANFLPSVLQGTDWDAKNPQRLRYCQLPPLLNYYLGLTLFCYRMIPPPPEPILWRQEITPFIAICNEKKTKNVAFSLRLASRCLATAEWKANFKHVLYTKAAKTEVVWK